ASDAAGRALATLGTVGGAQLCDLHDQLSNTALTGNDQGAGFLAEPRRPAQGVLTFFRGLRVCSGRHAGVSPRAPQMKRLETESLLWMRRIASARRRATLTTLNFPVALASSDRGMLLVTMTS